jgi:F0F1-type ATP synthase assembly protein I
MQTTTFDFLTSNRFWSIVITSLSAILIDPSTSTQPWYVTLGKFLGILGTQFTIVRTVDRNADKKVEVAQINSQG